MSVECSFSMNPLPTPQLISPTRPQPSGYSGPHPQNVPAHVALPLGVGPRRYCPPRYQHASEPWFLELNSIL